MKINTFTLFAVTLLGAVTGAVAVRPHPAEAAPAAVAAAAANDGKPFQAKTQSTFAASATEHNPFWPIGWVKTEEAATAASTLVPHATDFTVSTIMLNEPPMAVINGKEMAEGEVAALSVGGQPVTVQLMRVQDGRVLLRWQNQTLTVPLHRNEELSKGDAVAGQTALLR